MKRCASFLFFLLISVTFSAYAQVKPADPQQRTLFLQLSSSFLFVVNENRIDLDSALLMASTQGGMNRLYIVGEKMADVFDKTNNEDPGFYKRQLATSKGLKRIRLLNLIGALYTFQPGSRSNDLDSAFFYLKTAEKEALAVKDDQDVYQSLCVQGKYYFETANLAMADTCFKTVIDQCARTGNKEYEAMAWYYWSTYAPFGMYPYDKRISYSLKALEIYLQRKQKEAAVNTLTNLGYMSYCISQAEDCKKYNFRALELERDIHFPYKQYNEDLMAFIYGTQGNYPQQLKYAVASLKSVQSTADSIGYPYFCFRMSTIYSELGKNKESLEWIYNGINAFKKMGRNYSVYKTTENLSNIAIKSGDAREITKALLLIEATLKEYPPVRAIDKQYLYLALAACHYNLKEYALSAKYYALLEVLQKETGHVNGNYNKSYFDIQLGYYAFNTKQYEKSRDYFMQVLNPSSPQAIGLSSFTNMHWMLFRIDSIEGKHASAMLELLQYSRLVDSIYNATESKQVSEIKIQYETEKKDNNIKLLVKQAELRDSQLTQERLTRNVFVGGAIMLALLLGLAYNRYRLKQRVNRQLEKQQMKINEQNFSLQSLIREQQKLLSDKEWLVKEIHHRVKNNLQIVISLLNTQAAHLDEGDARMAIQESRHRMQVISLLHQKLYQAETSSLINMQVYIREVVSYLKESFKGINHLYLEQQIDSIYLDISQAVPVGLILNEAITNCIKYAFPHNKNGYITVSFKKESGVDLLLTVADNGIGIPKNIDPAQRNSMGMRLMQTLSEQLDGSIKIESMQGTTVKVCFTTTLMENVPEKYDNPKINPAHYA